MLKTAVLAVLLLLPVLSLSAAPLPYRVWQLQDYNMGHIGHMIDLAAAQGANRVQLSHGIVMNVDQPLSDPQLARDINAICRHAHSKGLRVDMWTHELTSLPQELMKEGRADLDNPKLWEYVRGKYDRLFAACPDLDGLVLTMQETAMSIYHEKSVASSVPPEQRVAKLIDELAGVCASRGKELFVRTFSYEPAELKYIQRGLKLCKSDVIAMTKCVPHDWQPYYPYNPAIGDVGGKRQVVEFDLGHEFTGLSTIPYVCVDYVKRHLDYDISRGVVGVVLRVERFKWWSLDTPNQAVLDVATKLLSEPSADHHKLYTNWLEERYGKDAAPFLFSAFMRTQEIVDKGYFVLGFWVTNHSLLPGYNYAAKSLRERTSAKWDPSTRPTETELFNPTAATISRIGAEKDAALRLVNESLGDLEKAKPHMKPEDYTQVRDLFEREKAMVVTWKAAMEVFFGINIYKRTGTASDARFLSGAADRLEKIAAENKSHLVKMASDYSNPDKQNNVNAALGLAQLARETLQQKH